MGPLTGMIPHQITGRLARSGFSPSRSSPGSILQEVKDNVRQLKPAGNLPQEPPKTESLVACQGTPFCWPVKISDRTTPALLRGNTALASYSHSTQLTLIPVRSDARGASSAPP